MPAPASSGSEYIPAVDSLNEISDSGYERDDDWRPKVSIDKTRRYQEHNNGNVLFEGLIHCIAIGWL